MVLALSVTWFIFLLCLIMGVAAWMIFWWSIRTGQFLNADDVADLMLELDQRD